MCARDWWCVRTSPYRKASSPFLLMPQVCVGVFGNVEYRLLFSFVQWFLVSGVLLLLPVKGIPPPHMNQSAIHTNTVYFSGFELCLLKNWLCCNSGVPGIWNWLCATVSTCKSLELLSAFPSWLCASTAFTGIVTYLFSLFFDVHRKLGI